MTKKITDPMVRAAFEAFPPAVRRKLMSVGDLIYSVAGSTPGVGDLEETLKWGHPSYLTPSTKSGSTIRLGREKKTDGDFGIYFKCNTNLVASFKNLYGDRFRYEGNRAILFNVEDPIPARELRHCLALALTYHLNKKAGRDSPPSAQPMP